MIRHLKIILFATSVIGFGCAYGAYTLGFERWRPAATYPNGYSVPYPAQSAQICFKAHALALLRDADSEELWQRCQSNLAAFQALDGFTWRSDAVVWSGLIGLIALFGFALSVRFSRPPFKIIRGARLFAGSTGRRAFRKACARECKAQGRGILVAHPDICISRERETRHVLILGSVGGGKTQTMLQLMSGALQRGDGILVLDTKGDMMAGLPGHPEPLLVAPHDKRSLIWDIAADCCVKQDARELAARFIPSSTDPMWSEAAREIFVACIVHLQQTRGKQWSWADLQEAVNADHETLTKYARDHHLAALRLLDQPESRTTHSILTTFRTHMRIVAVLADAWPDLSDARFSIRGWLHKPTPYRPLILQHDPGYPELSRIWIGSMLGLFVSAVGSPTLSESKQRRIWLFLDEFPQLPAIKSFGALLELGRSKGIAVVIGAQDTAQIRAVYGPDQTKAWFALTGTKVFTRINTSEAAEDISRMIGDQEIERPIQTTTRTGGTVSVSDGVQREFRRVITASELGSRLGPTKHGVKVLVVGLGDAAYELTFPYIQLASLRPSIIPAAWTYTSPEVISMPPVKPEPEPVSRLAPALSKDLAERIRQIRE